MNGRWPNQEFALSATTEAIEKGDRRICVTSPTGSGKTRMQIDLLEWATFQGWQSALFTNRRLLCKQIKDVLESHKIYPGMRASGYKVALARDVQLCMTQSEKSMVFDRKKRELHDAKLVIIDEAHLQKGKVIQEILNHYIERGAVIVGYTATPLDLGDLYDHLIVAATMSECFNFKAIVPADTFAPDEPDLKHIRQYSVGAELSERDNSKAIMRPGIFGRVLQHWENLNPDGLPTILFAPGVKESIYFAEQFNAHGIRAAHIDGSDVWLDGGFLDDAGVARLYDFEDDTPTARDYVIDLVRKNEVKVICNRFVLREGIDLPELRYGILATVFGSLSSYLQSCGRLLRSAPGKERAIIQDHGGNWNRHGSVNADRDWFLGQTNHRAVGERQERIRERQEPEPVVCGECYRAYMPMLGRCPHCGHVARGKSRMVVEIDGSLKPVSGDIFPPRNVRAKPDSSKRWERYYYSQKKAGRTFNQAYAWFFHEEHYWPPKNLPMMPEKIGDWFSKIGDVPKDRLIPKAEAVEVAGTGRSSSSTMQLERRPS